MEKATFAGGCFWCLEAVFRRVKGVIEVDSGYAGGQGKNPTYVQVSTGKTGYAEAVRLIFDPNQISYEELLRIFWKLHDPTTLNRQGPDVGTQYRSIMFYHSDRQRRLAEKSKREVERQFRDPIVTEILPAPQFYRAEGYHQEYYERNPDQPYCRIVIDPKIQKLNEEFSDFLK